MTAVPGDDDRSAEVRRGMRAFLLGTALGGMLIALAKRRMTGSRQDQVDSKVA